MCTVYRALHADLGAEFAIKILHGNRPDDSYVERLRREAAAGIRIHHPRVVKVMELGMSARGPFLVMELVRGETLFQVLRREKILSSMRAANIARQVAEGLAAAHRIGYVHRDLKPSNIMVVPGPAGDQVKILDFGIVRIFDGACEKLTRDDLILGTPAYMAPEQFHSSHVGPTADLYALGVILFEMLAGKPPFSGTFKEIVAQHMMVAPEPLPDSAGLEELADWLLEKKQEERPQNAAAVIEVIDRRFPGVFPIRNELQDGVKLVVGQPIPPPGPPAVSSTSRYTAEEILEAQLDTLVS
jgi:serine/threonine-protein kinase